MVLYINGNYPHHSLHGELVSKLADLGNDITVFVPMRGRELEGKYRCDHPGVEVIYCDCLRSLDRVFFIHKIRKIAREIEKRIDLKQINCILAGTVYSDGGVAYLLHRKYGIPFSVAARETDVTYQMKWRPYLNGFVKHLLGRASKLVFLSPAYKKYFDRFDSNQDKCVIIPNAVNDYWFQESQGERRIHNPASLIFVGEISKRKNVGTAIMAVAELKNSGFLTVFHIVGSGDEEENCRALAKRLGVENQVFFHGWQNDKEKIKEFYDQADIFVMPSHRETFGTVYVEALSQGLPIIYTKGQGIDGYFEQGEVGYSCDPNDKRDIKEAIIHIIDNYESISGMCISASKRFQWKEVSSQYNDVINSMRNN